MLFTVTATSNVKEKGQILSFIHVIQRIFLPVLVHAQTNGAHLKTRVRNLPYGWFPPYLASLFVHYAQVDDHWGFANGIEAQRQYDLWFTADDELTDVSETLLAKFFSRKQTHPFLPEVSYLVDLVSRNFLDCA